MTTLSFRTAPFTLSAASEDIGEIYQQVAAGLPHLGFTNVRNEPDHVFAESDATLLDVFFLFNGVRSFWQVIACAGEVGATNDQVLDQVQAMIAGFSNL
nr:hypothetical protein [uncultured Lichenicoccus sp.]